MDSTSILPQGVKELIHFLLHTSESLGKAGSLNALSGESNESVLVHLFERLGNFNELGVGDATHALHLNFCALEFFSCFGRKN